MMTGGVGYAQDDGAKPGGQPISSGKPEVPADEEPAPEPMPDEKVEPDPEPEPLPVPISEPKPVQTLKADKKKVDKPVEWRGFVHIRCECGQAVRYLTNIPDYTFDIPCATCGSLNTVTYHRGKDCYVPVGHAPKHGRAKKKK